MIYRYLILLFLVGLACGTLSQRISSGVQLGAESNSILFDELYTLKIGESSVSFNQLYYNNIKGSAFVKYIGKKRFSNQLNFAFTIDDNFVLASDDKKLSIYNYSHADGNFQRSFNLVQQVQLTNKFLYTVVKGRRISIDATLAPGYQFILRNRTLKYTAKQYRHNRITDAIDFENILPADFVNQQLTAMTNYFTFDYGLSINFPQISVGISVGNNISTLGSSTVFGKLSRSEVSIAYSLINRRIDLSSIRTKPEEKNTSHSFFINSSMNSIYLKLIQPIRQFTPLKKTGTYYSDFVYLSGSRNFFHNGENFGLHETNNYPLLTYNRASYDIYSFTQPPEFSPIPGLAVGLKRIYPTFWFSTFEAGIQFTNLKFTNTYYSQGWLGASPDPILGTRDSLDYFFNDFGNDDATVSRALHNLNFFILSPFISTNLYYSHALGRKMNYLIGGGLSVNLNCVPFNVYAFEIMWDWDRPLLLPYLMNGSALAMMGIERNLMSLEFQYSVSILNYLAYGRAIGLGRLNSLSVSLKIPIAKINSD